MKSKKKVFDTISKQFSGVVDVNCEGSEEYQDSMRVFISLNLELNNKSSKKKDNGYDPLVIEQWTLQALQKTFKK